MGRAKLRLKFMNDEKVRRITYENRMKGLLKKAKELSILCGVDLCMIIYGQSRKSEATETTVWPRNQDQVAELIDSYMSSRSCDDSRHRSYDLSKFYKDQTEKIEEEIKKLRENTREVTYPKWDESYNRFSLEQLKELASILTTKIDAVTARINFLNTSAKMFDTSIHQAQQLQQQPPLSYNDIAQSFTENERRMMMLSTTINNHPSCYNNGYCTYNENPGNYMYNCIENQIQNCGLVNPIMEIDPGFTNADLLMSHHVPQNGQGLLLSSSFPSNRRRY